MLYAGKALRAKGIRVTETLNAEELTMKQAYLSSGMPDELWAKGIRISWRRGQLVMMQNQKWEKVPLPTTPIPIKE